MIIVALALAVAQASPAAPPTGSPVPETPAPVAPERGTVVEGAATPERDVPVSSRVPRRVNYVTSRERDAAWTMHRFAECLVRNRRAQMLELLGTRLNSPEQAVIVRDVIGRRSICLGARAMRIDNVLLRGAVAEALYRREQRGGRTGPLAGPPELPAADPRRNPAAALARFGRCLVASDPSGVQALIEARPGSEVERSALAALTPGFRPCLAEGQTPDPHPLLLRGALAEAFYLHSRGLLDTGDNQARRTP